MSAETLSEAGRAKRGRLEGKVAVITGAGSGMGRAAAARFVREGACVAAADIDLARAQETCEPLGGDALAVSADVRDPHAVHAMVDAAVERFGSVDVLFSNAGVAEAVKPVSEIAIEEWHTILDINLTAFFLCVRAVLPTMRAGGGGSIILTGSIAARRPRQGLAAYVASKSGATGLARALAFELAPERIRVNVINPGPAHTPMVTEFGFARGEQATLDRLRESLPLGEVIEPEDIADAAVYLAGEESSKVTGLLMNVDAGRDL